MATVGAIKNHLKAIRTQKKLSQMGLYVISGVSHVTISAVEKWGLYPVEPTRKRLCDALEVKECDVWPEPPDEALCCPFGTNPSAIVQ